MRLLVKIKGWFKKNKKYIYIGGSVALAIVGASIGYVLYNNNKLTFDDWLKLAFKEELDEAYEKLRLEFCKTGTKPFGMEKISRELGERGAKEWFKNHPRNPDPNFRWTDANRWDRD